MESTTYTDGGTYTFSNYVTEPNMDTVTTTHNLVNSTMSTTTSTDLLGFFAAFIGIILLVALASYAISAFLLSRIFKKAGIEAWKAWVPFYNIWVFLEIGKQKGWYLLLNFVPFVGSLIFLIFYIMAAYNIGKSLGKDGIFVLWAVFIPVVWYIWLGFDNSTWENQSAVIPPVATTTEPVPAPVVATEPQEAPQEEVSSYPQEPVISQPVNSDNAPEISADQSAPELESEPATEIEAEPQTQNQDQQ